MFSTPEETHWAWLRPYRFPAHAQILDAESVPDVSLHEVGAPLSQPDGSEAETEVVVGHLVVDGVVGQGRPGSRK